MDKIMINRIKNILLATALLFLIFAVVFLSIQIQNLKKEITELHSPIDEHSQILKQNELFATPELIITMEYSDNFDTSNPYREKIYHFDENGLIIQTSIEKWNIKESVNFYLLFHTPQQYEINNIYMQITNEETPFLTINELITVCTPEEKDNIFTSKQDPTFNIGKEDYIQRVPYSVRHLINLSPELYTKNHDQVLYLNTYYQHNGNYFIQQNKLYLQKKQDKYYGTLEQFDHFQYKDDTWMKTNL